MVAFSRNAVAKISLIDGDPLRDTDTKHMLERDYVAELITQVW